MRKGSAMLKRPLALLVFACGLTVVFGVVLGGSLAQAQTTYYWTTTGGTMVGGSGTWDPATTANWSLSATGDPHLTTWTAGSNADFSYGSGTVAVSGAPSVGNITFDPGTAYTLTGGTLSLGSGIITANANATINSCIATGPTGLTSSGTGVLTLSGVNTYNGGTTVAGGALIAVTPAALPSYASVSVSPSAALGVRVGGAGEFAQSDVRCASARRRSPPARCSASTRPTAISPTAGTSPAASAWRSTAPTCSALTGNINFTGPTTFSGGTVQLSGVVNFGGAISGNGAGVTLIISGGTTTLSGNNAALGNANNDGSYANIHYENYNVNHCTGNPTIIEAGAVLSFSSGSNLPQVPTNYPYQDVRLLVLNGGTLLYTGTGTTDSTLLNLGASTQNSAIDIQNAGANFTLGWGINGVYFNKTGLGTLTLGGPYFGNNGSGFSVLQGTLVMNAAGYTNQATSSVSAVSLGATLQMGTPPAPGKSMAASAT